LRDECSRVGARLVIAIPPVRDFRDARNISQAATEAGVQPLLSFGPADLSPEDFRDGHHASEQGRHRYTAMLIKSLNTDGWTAWQ
jgi:hypothetical protein